MKRTFATQGKSLFAMLVLLAGMLFGAHSAQAQQSLNGSASTSGVSFKPAQDVVSIAKDQVAFWHQQGPYSPGTTNYYNQMRHAAYFKAVAAAVESGSTVAEAIEQSLGAAATVGGEKEAAFTSKTVLAAVKEEAIELFKQ
jgi:hypothetical protein